MPSDNFDQFDLLDELDEIDRFLPRVKNAPGNKRKKRPRLKDKFGIISEPEVAHAIYIQRDDIHFLDFTYQPSETEQQYLIESLGGFFEQSWFDDILQIVKGGKEASVYLVKGGQHSPAPLLAAKVYRPRIFRALKNDHLYRQGRSHLDQDGLEITNEGKLKALQQRSSYGKQLEHTSWIEHEVSTMQILRAAGCDVPRCHASGGNAILMDFIGSAEMAAPTLNLVRLDPQEAQHLFLRVLDNIRRMLACDRVHGDLSAFNILYWEGEITLIDFPQAIDPHQNSSAFAIFQRDVTRVCEYFQRQGVPSDPARLAQRLWAERGLQRGPYIHPALLDPDDEADVKFWRSRR